MNGQYSELEKLRISVAICHPLEYFYFIVCAFELARGRWIVVLIQNAELICGNGMLHFFQRQHAGFPVFFYPVGKYFFSGFPVRLFPEFERKSSFNKPRLEAYYVPVLF